MKNLLITFLALFTCIWARSQQAPDLVIKKELNSTLLAVPRDFTKANGTDVLEFPFQSTNEYTLEVKGKIRSAEGRGLDIEARGKDGLGYRTSVTSSKLFWSGSLSSIRSFAFSSAEEQTLRYAVKDGKVHIYQDGIFLLTKTLEDIKDILDDQEVPGKGSVSGSNLIAAWAGTSGNNSQKPTGYGWGSSVNTVTWNTANAGSGVRYMDVSAASSPVHTYSSSGATYSGRLLTLRWDDASHSSSIYSLPVSLSAHTSYKFSFDYELWANAPSGRITVRVSKDKAGTEVLMTKDFRVTRKNGIEQDYLTFTSGTEGPYYLLFTGSSAMYGIGNLNLTAFSMEPRIVIGKNYQAGAVDMQVSGVTFDPTGAYAPAAGTTIQNVHIENETIEVANVINKKITMSGKSELHITSTTPLVNSLIDLQSKDAWLYIHNIKPSRVMSAAWFTGNVKVEGKAVSNNVNARVVQYIQGTVVIPYGNETAQAALTVYTEKEFTGESASYGINTYHRDLGRFNNAVKSFKLKKGYSATLANNPDGTGFSRYFIAEDEDLEINEMPEGLEFVSFIRVFPWNWVSKKGWAGSGYLDMTNCTWYYDWDANSGSGNNSEYTPMRHNAGWQSYSAINARNNSTHVLGFNEPERPDQANMSVAAAISQWPELFKSGLRIGSPAPSSPTTGWLNNFMKTCDSLNYRVDYAAVHCYAGGQNGSQWASKMSDFYNNYAHKRPIWITEFNNGANWTSESWPSGIDAQYQKQLKELTDIMTALDNSEFVERYAFYNWVEGKRAVVTGNSLTPAGEFFSAHPSKRAFTKSREYIHKWKIAPPWIKTQLSADSKKFLLKWYDHNGETGTQYIIERKLANESGYKVVGTVCAEKDYQYGGEVVFQTDVQTTSAKYRVKAVSYKNTESIYSREISFLLDPVIAAPSALKGTVISSSIVDLSWNAVSNARSYNLKRSTSAAGTYETIAEYFTGTTYRDENLKANTSYYYKISANNNRGETADCTPVPVKTTPIPVPEATVGILLSSGDAKVTMTWEHQYDVLYRIHRSVTENGAYAIVSDSISGLRFVDSTVVNGHTYYYKIEAFNSAGKTQSDKAYTASPEEGRHLYLAFDEESGTKAIDGWGAYHGELYNNVQRTGGVKNEALSFSATDKSYVQLENGVVSGLEDFTISTWMNYSAISVNSRVFDFGNSTSVFMVFCPKSGDNIRYKITCPAGTYTADAPYTLPTSQWLHLALTQEGTTLKMYIDGKEIYSDDQATVKPSDMGITNKNYLVRSQWSSDPYSTCMLDEFRMYNRALNPAEINALMNSATGLKQTELSRATIYLQDRVLYIDTPEEETVEIYSVTSQLIARKEKKAGLMQLEIPSDNAQVFIVRGSSGWVSKVIQ